MQENNVIKEVKLGNTKIKFCDEYMAKTEEEKYKRIMEFKLASIRLVNS